ncbi:MAG: hypothetical protein IPK76_24165 [Lewinellaceae bacterium]|nr:hypothetical protein [Lewinellaceae bacterium]
MSASFVVFLQRIVVQAVVLPLAFEDRPFIGILTFEPIIKGNRRKTTAITDVQNPCLPKERARSITIPA